MATEATPVVELDEITCAFGDQVAVDSVSLTVDRSSILGIIGPSGCGKSTLVRLTTGLLDPTAGSARVFGADPATFGNSARRRIGYMPQLPVLYPNLSLWQNLNFTASLYGVRIRRRERLAELLDFVDLGEHRRKRLADASGGMQRRLALAAALVHDPELVFLDEPTAGIDPILREKIWGRLRDLRDEGRTLVVTTQYVGEAVHCDRVALLSDGHLITVDTPEDLRRRAFGGDLVEMEVRDPATRGVLDSVDRLAGVREVTWTGPRRANLVVDDGAVRVPDIVEILRAEGNEVERAEVVVPDYDSVFVRLIEQFRATAPAGEDPS